MARDLSPIGKQSRREGYALAPKAQKVMASLNFAKSKKFAAFMAYSKSNSQNSCVKHLVPKV